ncbi:MAG: hypothetical protein KAR20_29580, partial [Candidatus Heimdallarchaeota archaeon]|nr:hypothetical protein [Candidatus Heimdallarchaeota archaeon]
MENPATTNTGIECLRGLAITFCRDINFDALLNGDLLQRYTDSPCDVLLEISNQLHIGPELVSEAKWNDVFKDCQGPVLCALSNDNWVCVIKAEDVVAKKKEITVFDPLTSGRQKIISVPLSELKKNWNGQAIRFKNLFIANDGSNTALFCLSSVGKHHGVDMDVRRLLHEYAVEDDEINERLFFKIISDNNLKSKEINLTWEKIPRMGEAFPLIAKKNNGKYILICGFQKKEDEERVVVIDQEAEKTPGQQFVFWSKEQYESEYSGKAYLVKRIYSLLDENQPFGLRWFIPEFLKLKGMFGQIALAVLMISGLALITPLFFQIVVDKVLTNESYTTLNVLGVGIILALLFNALLEFLRGYLLIFATNKIDISTATKTFHHLMRLPVEFFEHMS